MQRRFWSFAIIFAFAAASAVMIWQHQTRERAPIVVRVEPAREPSPPPPETTAPAPIPQVPTGASSAAPPSDDGHRPARMRGEGGITYLIRVLRNSRDFRVRAQVALSLGRIGSRRAGRALLDALQDRHPLVRAAAAEALGSIGGDGVVAALEAALAREREADTKRSMQHALAKLAPKRTAPKPRPKPAPEPGPAQPTGYRVAIARPSAAGHAVTSGQLAALDQVVRSRVGGLAGVQTIGVGNAGGDGPAFHLDVAVSSLEDDGRGNASAVVSIMVSSHPGRDLRGIIKGKIRVEDYGEPSRAAMVALEGAAKSAVRQLPATFARSSR